MLELAARLRELPRRRSRRRRCTRASSTRTACATSSTSPRLLLAPDSLDHALSRLDRARLAVLAAAAELAAGEHGGTTADAVRGELVRLGGIRRAVDAATGLLGDSARHCSSSSADGRVARAHRGRRAARPRTRRRPPGGGRARRTRASRARERRRGRPQPRSSGARPSRAYATVAATAELLAELGTQPARELAKGGLALPDSQATRRVERHRARRTAPPVPSRRRGRPGRARRRVLARVRPRRRLDAAERGRPLAPARRSAGATAFPRRCASSSRAAASTLTATDLRDDVRWFYPAGGRWIDEGLDRLVGDAEALGLAVAGEPVESRPARARRRHRPCGAARLATHFPAQVDKVYLQHDLSIVSPGPLEPRARRAAARRSPTSRAATSPPPIASARHP